MRQKTYSAETGYVYQYYYEGRKDAPLGSHYTFQVTADRHTYFPLVIFVPDAVIQEWEAQNRPLTSTERYAIAKLALMQACDQRQPGQLRDEVRVSVEDVETISTILGFV